MSVLRKEDGELPGGHVHRHALRDESIERGILLSIERHGYVGQPRERRPIHDFTTALHILDIDVFPVRLVHPFRHWLRGVLLYESKDVFARDLVTTDRSVIGDVLEKGEGRGKPR